MARQQGTFQTAQETAPIAEAMSGGLDAAQQRFLGERIIGMEDFVLLEAVASPYEKIRQQLAERVVDQDAAIDAIVEALDRVDIRRSDDYRPIASLAFLGPTGVGKSETAKTLSTLMTEGEGNLVKIDCSNFSNGHEVTALLGSPPSYVGHDIAPQFAKGTVEVPGTVILFDEIEKGSSALYNLMLQIMGDGKLRVNNGDVVSFRETVIILTSNLGAQEMSDRLKAVQLGFGDQTIPKDKAVLENIARRSFTNFFSPEFVNRLNKTVVFHPLDDEGLGRVLNVKLAEANEEYEKKHGVRLSLSDATRAHLVTIAAKDRHLGARPLIRALEDNVETMLGRYTGSGTVPEGTHIRVIHRDELSPSTAPTPGNMLLFTSREDKSIHKQRQLTKPPVATTPFSLPETDE
jgi:ATP-dependent Clp protease ATP-binding subunit ClpA